MKLAELTTFEYVNSSENAGRRYFMHSFPFAKFLDFYARYA
jgi:hypothetical protein